AEGAAEYLRVGHPVRLLRIHSARATDCRGPFLETKHEVGSAGVRNMGGDWSDRRGCFPIARARPGSRPFEGRMVNGRVRSPLTNGGRNSHLWIDAGRAY